MRLWLDVGSCEELVNGIFIITSNLFDLLNFWIEFSRLINPLNAQNSLRLRAVGSIEV